MPDWAKAALAAVAVIAAFFAGLFLGGGQEDAVSQSTIAAGASLARADVSTGGYEQTNDIGALATTTEEVTTTATPATTSVTPAPPVTPTPSPTPTPSTVEER